MSGRLRVAVVFPSFNEEANLESTLERAFNALEALDMPYEVVVVDDASTDGTPEVLRALAATRPWLEVVRNPVNMGAGTSVLIGLKRASADIVIHNSMDYPFDLLNLGDVLPLFPRCDVVAVVREDRSAHSAFRKLTSWVHHWLVRLLFRVPFRDMNFVQSHSRAAIAELSPRARSPAFVTPELLIRAQDLGMKVGQVKATFYPRAQGRSSYGKPRDILWTLSDMLSFWWERGRT